MSSELRLGHNGAVAVVLAVAVCDITIYRGAGYAGYAALFVIAPVLLVLGTIRPTLRRDTLVVLTMLLLLSARLIWCGGALSVAIGFSLLIALAMCLAGRRPYVLEAIVFAAQSIPSGFHCLNSYGQSKSSTTTSINAASGTTASAAPHGRTLEFALPLLAAVLFTSLFVLANPDLVAIVSRQASVMLHEIRSFLMQFSPVELLFWITVLWVTAGLIRPRTFDESQQATDVVEFLATAGESPASPLYAAFRNTLVTTSLLFVVYLFFEFKTLWFQVFPQGFYYAGYAHEGAAWLTCALALSTVMLSAMFRGEILRDARLPQLKHLAWFWSALNFLLAVAVYHRLLIYVGFNGMTRMRTIGFFGTTAVVAGFALVTRTIARQYDFRWLIRRNLWTLAVVIFLYAITPVDLLVHRYNIRRILAGDPAPAVQISVHPISAEGVLVLPALNGCDDAIIHSGILAMLAERQIQAETERTEQERLGWTAFQLSDSILLDRLRGRQSRWQHLLDDPSRRSLELKRFHAYVYQWY